MDFKKYKGNGIKRSEPCLKKSWFWRKYSNFRQTYIEKFERTKYHWQYSKNNYWKKYYEIEEKMRNYSKFCKIDMDELDLVLWYKEAGEVFK